MSNTFLHCRGFNVGKSVFEPGMERLSRKFMIWQRLRLAQRMLTIFWYCRLTWRLRQRFLKIFLVKKLILIK